MTAEDRPEARRFMVCTPIRMSHYSVMGEPPEPYATVVEVEASTRRDALIMASRLPEMQDYATEMRGDNRPPWFGLDAIDLTAIDAREGSS